MDAIDAKRNNRYSVTSFLTTPLAHQLMYYVYIRVAVQGAFSRHSSIYRVIFHNALKQRITVLTPIRSKITYYMYVGFVSDGCFLVLHLFIALFYIYVLKANNCGSAMQDGIGAARRRPHRTPSLTKSTSDCAVLLRSRHTKRSDIMSERYLLCEC